VNRPALVFAPLILALVFLAAEGDRLAAARANSAVKLSAEFPFESKFVQALGSRMLE
jgi:hypothetical protein